MFRMLWMLMVAGAITYGLFTIQLAERSLALHLWDVWDSPTVQQKRQLVRQRVPKALAETMPSSLKAPLATWREGIGADKKPQAPAKQEAHTEQDRKSLDALVEKARGEPR